MDGYTALHYAVKSGHLAIVQALLQVEGVNVNAKVYWGFWAWGETPLHLACSGTNAFVLVQALLEAGADPNEADVTGETPLFSATRDADKNVVEALLDAGANPAVRNNRLDTPLHTACRFGPLDVVQVLIRRQGSECLTLRDVHEETPLDRLGLSNYELFSEEKAPIRQHILQSYARMIAQRDGLLCLHSVLQDTAFTDVAAAYDDDDDDDSSIIYEEGFHLSVGTLNTEDLQKLLEYIIAAGPDSVRAVDGDGLTPLLVAVN